MQNKSNFDNNILYIPSKRHVTNIIYNNYQDIKNALNNLNFNNNINRRQDTSELIQVLINIICTKNKIEIFNKYLKNFFPKIKWQISSSFEQENGYIIEFNDTINPHFFEGVGDGLVTIFYICLGLFYMETGDIDILVIDEPEVSLHPDLIKKASKLLTEASKNHQIIISTHSPYFINWNAIASGANLIRVFKDNNESIVKNISEASKHKINKQIQNSKNPHVFGIDSSEAFFLKDRIIVVEGQEDVICYKKMLDVLKISNSFNFYGWGAGGAENVYIICKILYDLGYSKVVAIFDDDKKGEMNKCRNEYKKYRFYKSQVTDIRDKWAYIYNENKNTLSEDKKLVKTGIFDKDFKLKDLFYKYEKSYRVLFNNISKYFNE